jgi:hypothetical protein
MSSITSTHDARSSASPPAADPSPAVGRSGDLDLPHDGGYVTAKLAQEIVKIPTMSLEQMNSLGDW